MKQGSNFVVALVTVGGIVAACLLSACGSGGSGSSTNGTNVSQVAVSSSGTVTNFGSVYVNDRKYEINDATKTSKDDVTVTGDVSAKSLLKVGMVVTVSGLDSGGTRTAATIQHDNTLEGPISSVDPTNSRFIVLGQTVLVDDTTTFDSGVTLGNLIAGHVVEVSGFVKADGSVAASFIERKAPSGGCTLGCEVKGLVKFHNHATTSFQIGSLTVKYSGASIDNTLPAPTGSNWNGLFVEVKGTAFDAGTTTLTASRIETEGFQASNGDQVELEGFVTSVAGMPTTFVLGSTTVQLTGGTVYLGGLSSEITVGQKLEVQGSISNGVITATKVKFQDGVRIESNVASKPTASSLILDGVPGVTVLVNSQTAFKNVANLSAVAVGNNVRVRGREGAGNTVIATEVERKSASPDNNVVLQGVVQTVANPSLTVLGVTINTIGLQLKDINDNPINPTTFFGAVTAQQTVIKAKGRLIGPPATSVWEELELESE